MPGGEVVIFGVISVLLIITALLVVFARNLFHSAIFLALFLTLTAVIYLLLQAEMLAFLQILLYTGGVVTLIIFAIMLTRDLVGGSLPQTNRNLFLGIFSSLAIFLTFFFFIQDSQLVVPNGKVTPVSALKLAQDIFMPYALPFEVLSIILVIAIIGAIVLARKEE